MPYLSDGSYGNYLNLSGGAGVTVKPPALSLPLPKPGYSYQIGTISAQVVTSYSVGSTDFTILSPTGISWNKQTDGSTGLLHTVVFQPITPLVVLPGDYWSIQLAISDINPPSNTGSGTVYMQTCTNQGWALSGTSDPVGAVSGAGGYVYIPVNLSGYEVYTPQAIPLPANQGLSSLTLNWTGYFDIADGAAQLLVNGSPVINTAFAQNAGFTAYSSTYNFASPQMTLPSLTAQLAGYGGGSGSQFLRVNMLSVDWTSKAPPGTGGLNAYVSISVEGQFNKWPGG